MKHGPLTSEFSCRKQKKNNVFFKLRAGRVHAASVSFGQQVIVFGGHLAYKDEQNRLETDSIGEISRPREWKGKFC